MMTTRRRCTSGSKGTAERALLVDTVGRMAREGWSVSEDRRGSASDFDSGSGALLSVWDKTGLPELARALHEAYVSWSPPATPPRRSKRPGFRPQQALGRGPNGLPRAFDGRVKTLHPRVHAGLLADTLNPDHNQQLTDLGIEPFQLLVSTLYPFEETLASGADDDAIIEKIDIGGPAMVRAAAKNHGSIAVITEIAQQQAATTPSTACSTPMALPPGAAQADATAAYDVAVPSWFAAKLRTGRSRQRRAGWPDLIAQVDPR